MTSIWLLVVLSALCAPCAVFYRKRYEDILPISAMGIVLVLFLFGLAGALKAGFIVVLICAAGLYAWALAGLLRKRNLKDSLRNLLTPGSIAFACALGLLSVWNRGKLAMEWDEFSHWVDIVKVMATTHDFGTNPIAESAFASYPPGMPLFQYFLQMGNRLLHPGEVFSEFRVYLAYQVFVIAVLLPLFRDKTVKSPVVLVCTAAAVFAGPLLFYPDLYASVYIDGFLGILSGAGFSAVAYTKEKDLFYSLYIWLLCAMLILAKDAGILFAVFLAGAYIWDLYRRGHSRRLICSSLAVAGVFLPRLLWKLEIAASGAKVSFSSSAGVGDAVRLLLGQDTTYRADVVENFRNALFEQQVTFGNISVSLNYAALLMTELLVFYLLYRACGTGDSQRGAAGVFGLAAAQLVAYCFGLVLAYAFRFTEYEAVRLASFTRYIHIGFLAGWILILAGLIRTVEETLSGNRAAELAVLYGLLLVVPLQPLADLSGGRAAKESQTMRKPYQVIAQKVMDRSPEGSKIYLVSQENTGLDYWALRFSIRPNRANKNYTWSIGEPFFDGDIWTRRMTAEQWKTMLLQEYDYVALYRVNEYFVENFAEVFEDPASIGSQRLYLVDQETGLLKLCE